MLNPRYLLPGLLVVLAGCAVPNDHSMTPTAGGKAGEWQRQTAARGHSQPAASDREEPETPVAAATPLPQFRATPTPAGMPVSPSNPPPPQMRVPPGWLSLDLWAADRQLPPAKSFSAEFGTAFELVAGAQRFAFQADSRTAWWNSLELMLGFAPLVAGGQIYLHKFDLEKNVAPLLSPAARIAKADRLVVIDAGHGGGNTGTRSALDGSQEKDYTLDWALRLAPLLEQAGWRVLLTRTNDVELTLPERVDFTVSNRADLFLSLHFNASGGGSTQSGIETYCLTPSGLPSNLTRDSDDDVRQVFPNNSFDQENVQWATRLHSSLLKFTDANDRGVRRARFMGVLRQQRCPAVLIEGGYLSNPEEARRIASGGYRQRLAEAVAAALR